MPHFTFEDTSLSGLKIIHRAKLGDDRGSFSRMFCDEELRQIGWENNVVQSNHTATRKAGTIRGLHFQKAPFAEIKIVNCLRGAVFDVAVDLRPQSPTFLKWQGCELSGDNWLGFYIPEGFAHGFQTLSDDVEMLYFHSQHYKPDHEGGIHPLDDMLDIKWPLELTVLSERDQNLGSAHNYLDLIN